MAEAKNGLSKIHPTTKIIAVTQLTSTTEQQLHEEQNIHTTIDEAVLNYARLAHKAGLDGVVCSPLEAELISRELGPEFMKVTPGIRPKGAAQNDQQRITTPEEAQTFGTTRIVDGEHKKHSVRPVVGVFYKT